METMASSKRQKTRAPSKVCTLVRPMNTAAQATKRARTRATGACRPARWSRCPSDGPRLEDLLSEQRRQQPDPELGGVVAVVEDRVDLDDLRGHHEAGVGQHLHGQVRLAVGDAARRR